MAKSDVTGAEYNVHKRNFFYYMISPYVSLFFFRFYGKKEVRGLENIPRNEPVIFAPNHQNALMDALVLLYAVPGDIVFLTRADIFSKKLLSFFLNSMKMLPVFRQRDGASELGKNVDIFDISVNVLHNRHNLCVMPEGSHGHQRKLRTIVKGIFRIGLKAQEEYGDKPFVKIQPVGFDIGDYAKQNQTILIQVGKPIEMSEYFNEYQENNARGINSVKKRLAEEMKPLMIHIESDEFYEAIYTLKGMFNDRMREIMDIKGTKLSDKFKADKELIDRMDAAIASDEEKVRSLAVKLDSYRETVSELNIRDWVVRDKGYNVVHSFWRYLSLILTFPLFLYGFINNAAPYLIPVRLVRNLKDRQFHSSVKFGLAGLITFPLFHVLQTAAVAIFTFSIAWWIFPLYAGTLLIMGKVALVWYLRMKKTLRGSWFRRQLRRKNSGAWELVQLRKDIMKEAGELITLRP